MRHHFWKLCFSLVYVLVPTGTLVAEDEVDVDQYSSRIVDHFSYAEAEVPTIVETVPGTAFIATQTERLVWESSVQPGSYKSQTLVDDDDNPVTFDAVTEGPLVPLALVQYSNGSFTASIPVQGAQYLVSKGITADQLAGAMLAINVNCDGPLKWLLKKICKCFGGAPTPPPKKLVQQPHTPVPGQVIGGPLDGKKVDDVHAFPFPSDEMDKCQTGPTIPAIVDGQKVRLKPDRPSEPGGF